MKLPANRHRPNGVATERKRTGTSSAGVRLGLSRTGEGHTAIEPLDTDLTEIRPLERRVDSVFRVRVAGEEGGFVLAVESQGKPDPDKHQSWTYYLAHLYAKYRLPPFLLVVCKDKATASWAAASTCWAPGSTAP
ncbi:hypothetical protein [Streptomyces sp. NPDC055793]